MEIDDRECTDEDGNAARAVRFHRRDREVRKLELEKELDLCMRELNELIGLEEVKNNIKSLVNLTKVQTIRKQHGLRNAELSLHLVFTGNPGTGKTTVARIIGKIYHAIGILSKGTLVEVDRSGLVAGYVGQTAIKTQKVIESALGGVLFIDEAYTLAPESSENDFGQEAIDTILKAMEDNREDFVVIVAGYPELMARFIESNPGLKSRFNKYISFADYTAEELYDIFLLYVSKSDYVLEDAAKEYVKILFRKVVSEKSDNFGNARVVRNLFEDVLLTQADRLVAKKDLDEHAVQCIAIEDIVHCCQKFGYDTFVC